MKATLTFSLPGERHEFETATNAMKWRGVVEDLATWFRSKLKYPPEDVSEDMMEVYRACSQELYGLLEDEHLGIDE